MLGQNAVADVDQHEDGSLNVNSLFYTIQGEGPDAGRPAVFLRLAKCNLRCWFCDTEFEEGGRHWVDTVRTNVMLLCKMHGCDLVVITGGEPLLQNIVPLIEQLNREHIDVSIETAGTVYLPGMEKVFNTRHNNLVVCSPKTPKLNEEFRRFVGAFKYVVRAGEIDTTDGLPIMSTQIKGESARLYRPSVIERGTIPIYLSPCDEGDPIANMENLKAAARSCMKHGFRLTVQIHKMVGLP